MTHTFSKELIGTVWHYMCDCGVKARSIYQAVAEARLYQHVNKDDTVRWSDDV